MPVIGKFWAKLKCSGCGARLERMSQIVEVLPEPKAPPMLRPLAHVVSHVVKCPTCSQPSKAVWTIDDGHVIDCPQCQRRKVDPETVVELVA